MKKIKTSLLVLFSACTFVANAQKRAKIDLTTWKLIIPEGSTTSFKGPKLLEYTENAEIQKYMFDDPTDRSLVFYAFPSMKSKRSFTKTELKEQNSFGSDIGWTFKEGAKLKASARMGEISVKNDLSPKVIIAQVNGRLKKDQMYMFGASSTDAPAILKVYWDNGFIKLRSKKLMEGMTGNEALNEDNWSDDDGYVFKDKVGQEKFTLEIEITDGKMEVTLNKKETKVYNGESYKQWNAFDNFFTIGCNLQSEEVGSFANMKYYSIEVTH